MRSIRLRLHAIVALALAGCATLPAGPSDPAENDPIEPFNRQVFAFNQALDHHVIKPVAKAYRDALPEPVRNSLRAFFDNLREPVVFANDLLQGRGEAAGISGRRFLINSTVGVLGFVDRATEFGLPKQSGDFGQTLYVWGVGDGPYLMLPFFGPSNVRDTLGLGVDAYAAPVSRIGQWDGQQTTTFAIGATDGVDLRSRNIESLDAIEAGSLDFYAYLRSVWRQNRQAKLDEAKGVKATDDELVDPGAGATTPAPTPTPSPPRPSP